MWTSATLKVQSGVKYCWQSGDIVSLPSSAWIGDALPTMKYNSAVIVTYSNGRLKLDIQSQLRRLNTYVCEQEPTGESCDVTWTSLAVGAVTTCVQVIEKENGVIWSQAVSGCEESGANLVSIQSIEKLDALRNFVEVWNQDAAESTTTEFSLTTATTKSDAMTSNVPVTDEHVSTTLTTPMLTADDLKEVTLKTTAAGVDVTEYATPSNDNEETDTKTLTTTIRSTPGVEHSTQITSTLSPSSTLLADTVPITEHQTTTRPHIRTTTTTGTQTTTQTPNGMKTQTIPVTTTRALRRRNLRTPAPDPVRKHLRPTDEPSWKEGDKRPSAIGVGVVAILLTAGFFVGLLLLDMAALRRDLRMLRRNIRYAFRRIKPRTSDDSHVVKITPIE